MEDMKDNKSMRKFICSLFFLAFSISCFSQSSFFDNYVYQSWSEFGGLSGTTANDIYQTKDGYIQIGTYEGLVKFDGVEFKTINRSTDKDYGFASARTIIQDSRGDIWVGSNDEGLHKISDTGNQIYTMESGLPNNSVRAFVDYDFFSALLEKLCHAVCYGSFAVSACYCNYGTVNFKHFTALSPCQMP